jgi:hypothetical protein
MPDAVTATSGNWFPLVAAFGGYIAGFITEWFRDERAFKRELAKEEATSAREREARQAARRVQLSERRANFQRETLLAAQDTATKLARTAGRIHHLDEMEYRKTEKWAGASLPEDLNRDSHEATVSLMVLTSRVRDDNIREMLKSLRSLSSVVGLSRTREQETEAMNKLGALLEPLHERIGEVLRKLDDDEDRV